MGKLDGVSQTLAADNTYINRVIELLKAVHGEEMGHSHAVVNQQLDKTDSIHHQRIQQGLLQGTNLEGACIYYEQTTKD